MKVFQRVSIVGFIFIVAIDIVKCLNSDGYKQKTNKLKANQTVKPLLFGGPSLLYWSGFSSEGKISNFLRAIIIIRAAENIYLKPSKYSLKNTRNIYLKNKNIFTCFCMSFF